MAGNYDKYKDTGKAAADRATHRAPADKATQDGAAPGRATQDGAAAFSVSVNAAGPGPGFAARIAAGSIVLRRLNALLRLLGRPFRFSVICAFLSRPEALTRLFQQSFLGRAAAAIPDACTRSLKHLGVFLNRAIPGSFTLWLLRWFGERFDVFFTLFVALHALLPFALYRNPYTIAALAFLGASACARVAFVRGLSATFSLKRVDPVFLLYFASIAASGAASLFGAGAGAASATTAVLYLAAICFTPLVANLYNDKRRLTFLICAIVFATFFIALYGIWQYTAGIPVDATQTDRTTGGASLAMGRADSTLGNPNVLAAWLLLVIPFTASLFFMAGSFAKKLLAASIAAPMAVCLLLTQSRSSWVGLFAAGVVYVFLLNWRLVPLFAAAAALSVPFWPQFILDRLLTAGSDTSSVYRFTIYAGAFRMALANWATGIGIGLEYFKRYINNYVYFAYETAPVHSHMLPLQIWLESGIVALASFLWMLARLVKKAGAFIFLQNRSAANLAAASANAQPATHPHAHDRQRGDARDLRLILIACVSAVAGFLVMGCFEYVWFFPRGMNHFFIIIGIFFCAVNLSSANK